MGGRRVRRTMTTLAWAAVAAFVACAGAFVYFLLRLRREPN